MSNFAMTNKYQGNAGHLTRRWNVICARCTEWDIPSGTKAQAEMTLRQSGWQKIGSRWICRDCIVRAEAQP